MGKKKFQDFQQLFWYWDSKSESWSFFHVHCHEWPNFHLTCANADRLKGLPFKNRHFSLRQCFIWNVSIFCLMITLKIWLFKFVSISFWRNYNPKSASLRSISSLDSIESLISKPGWFMMLLSMYMEFFLICAIISFGDEKSLLCGGCTKSKSLRESCVIW